MNDDGRREIMDSVKVAMSRAVCGCLEKERLWSGGGT